MVATKLDGTAIAKSIRERLGHDIAAKQKLNPRYKPCLKIIQGMSPHLVSPLRRPSS
jgi:methylenetetrahydrofolate dehydrogenase (NADP+)/methenyltetrahydrofolate cyclohydrolase/formyltetrahydrofolate synthetase